MSTLAGQVAIVTGGNSGIGAATVHRLAREGAKVVILARREPEGLAVVRAVKDAGGEATYIRCDITERPSVEAAVAGTVDSYGALHILVNNAGGAFPTPIDQADLVADENWDKTLRLNLTGTYLLCQAAWPHLIAAGGGRIVNISTSGTVMGATDQQRGRFGFHYPQMAAYMAAKGGVEALTRYVAMLGAPHRIRVNAIRPGRILTPMVAKPTAATGKSPASSFFEDGQLVAGPGRPEDIASAVYYLVSDESRFLTAQVLNLEGGLAYKV